MAQRQARSFRHRRRSHTGRGTLSLTPAYSAMPMKVEEQGKILVLSARGASAASCRSQFRGAVNGFLPASGIVLCRRGSPLFPSPLPPSRRPPPQAVPPPRRCLLHRRGPAPLPLLRRPPPRGVPPSRRCLPPPGAALETILCGRSGLTSGKTDASFVRASPETRGCPCSGSTAARPYCWSSGRPAPRANRRQQWGPSPFAGRG